jgi:thiol-disulfide isomerase/thioredoxin
MAQIILQRFLLSTEIILAFVLVVKSYGSYSEWKVRARSRKRRLPFPLKQGEPVLLYFWTSHCAQCKPQERQIERAQTVLQKSGKILKVQKLNALEEESFAKLMHIVTVPTTVLLNSEGTATTWNPGLTHADTIVKQYFAMQ